MMSSINSLGMSYPLGLELPKLRSAMLPNSGRFAAGLRASPMTREVAIIKSKCVVQSLDASASCVQNSRRLLHFRNVETHEKPSC